MATVGIQLSEWSGTSGMKIRLRAPGAGTVVNTGGDTLTESTTTGYFTATVGETLAGLHNVDVVNSSDVVIWTGGLVNMSIDPAYVDDPTQIDGLLTVGAVAGSVGSVLGGINTTSGTITTLDGLDTAQDAQHATTQTAIADVPTVAEFEARTLIAANYFDPAADTVATVTTVTNAVTLPSIPNGWITAAGITDGAFTAAKFASGAFDAVWSVTSRTLSAATNISSAIAAAVWEVATSGLSTAGTIGKLLVDNINATIGSRSSHSAADVWASGTRTLTAIDEDSTALDLDATIRAAIGMSAANMDTQLAAIPTTIRVKKNAALAGFAFPMVDSSDVLAAGLTVSGSRVIDGGSLGSLTNSVSEISGGFYKIDLAAADLNGNCIALKFSATGAKDTIFVVVTQP